MKHAAKRTTSRASAKGTGAGEAQAPLAFAPPSDPQIASLLTEYRQLVRRELPAAARAGHWSLRLDHCFARVILDALFDGCWYAHLSRGRGRSAESQLDAAQLIRAITLGRRMLAGGDAEVRRLDAQSLVWRGKAPKQQHRP